MRRKYKNIHLKYTAPGLISKYSLLFFLIFAAKLSRAQTLNDCVIAQAITQTVDYCSTNAQYSNANPRKYTWFKFTTTGSDVNINVSGMGAGGTLVDPQILLYNDCSGTELVGTTLSANNITSLYKGGLIIGNTYYIEVTGTNNSTGTFKICLNNYNPVGKQGQDCATAAFLCTTQTISEQNVVGAGLNNDEAKGTCLSTPGQVSESNSIWYKWQAANNGTLVFTITPSNTHDDIDWVLYDLGTTGDCANVNPANAIRCKAGSGVDNSQCPTDTIYYKTGLDFNEIDLSEPPGCGQGQNGKLKFVNCLQGHYYGLLINNFSAGNNGFTLAFSDQHAKAGTVVFAGPTTAFTYTVNGSCSTSPQYTFTNTSNNYSALKWDFGPDASTTTGTGEGPYNISYATPGIKTITLQASGLGGCTVLASQQINVGIKPPLPQILTDKTDFCVNDTVHLSANAQPGLAYSWTGPNGFHTDSTMARVPVTGPETAGIYKLVVSGFGCSSDSAFITLQQPLQTPTAAFHTEPNKVTVLYGPVSMQFINDTFNADTYLWDFGDGVTSTAASPNHTYQYKGNYNVKLTASRSNSCSISVTQYSLVIIQDNNYIFIPNTFTPNGDGVNDLFNVTITNLKSYHIQIFSRWGKLLFQSTDILNSWDGNYNNKQLPFGIYYYVIDGIGSNNAAIERSGYITLVR